MTAGKRFEGNLTAEIKQYYIENQGILTNAYVDRELGLVHRRDKQLRSWALKKMEKELYIKKDPRVVGKWCILSSSAEWIDLLNVPEQGLKNIRSRWRIRFSLHPAVYTDNQAFAAGCCG